jgi:hypothetical protein
MTTDPTQLSGIEQRLMDYLQSVEPDPRFIDSLNHRLARRDRTLLDYPRPIKRIWFVIGLGFLVGLATLWLLGGSSKRVSSHPAKNG